MSVFNPLESIRRFYDAENEYCSAAPGQRYISIMLKELDPDVVVNIPASLPHGGIWRGHEGFKELGLAVSRYWQEFEVVYTSGFGHQLDEHRVLTEGVLRAVLSATGNRIETQFLSLFTFTDRGLSYLDHYYKDTAAVVAAGR